jgi:Zn-dependent peptidase ImmA (M78 family)
MDELEEEGWGRSAAERLRARTAFCRKAAEQLLKRCAVQQPPVPVEQIARELGFEIGIVDLSIGVDARLRVTGARRIIELASGQSGVRHRFSIGHELGHACLAHRHGETEVAEQEANAFAGALLVPAAWLRRDLDRFPTASALADRYQVSREVIFIAAQRARLLGKLR